MVALDEPLIRPLAFMGRLAKLNPFRLLSCCPLIRTPSALMQFFPTSLLSLLRIMSFDMGQNVLQLSDLRLMLVQSEALQVIIN